VSSESLQTPVCQCVSRIPCDTLATTHVNLATVYFTINLLLCLTDNQYWPQWMPWHHLL